MNDAMYIAATGIQAQKTMLDVVANNVANINTSGFKRSNVRFYDLMTTVASQQAPSDTSLTGLAGLESAVLSAAGVGVSAVGRQFDGGDLKATGNPLDIAIRGAGFIEVVMPDGGSGYFRGGALQINNEGLLSTAQGHPLKQRIQVPTDAKGLAVSPDGVVQITAASGQTQFVGRLDLIQFANPEALASMGDNLYQASPQAGEPLVVVPAETASGSFAQGFLEASNVKLVDEMLHLMVAQRAYEMNVKVMQAADEMAGLTNNLRK